MQETDPPKSEIYCSNSVILVRNNSSSLADVVLAHLKSPVFSDMTDEDFVDCSLFSNDINDLLSLYKVDAASTALLIKVADLIREVDIVSVNTCTLDTLDPLTPVTQS